METCSLVSATRINVCGKLNLPLAIFKRALSRTFLSETINPDLLSLARSPNE
jgi:hypothetical protein